MLSVWTSLKVSTLMMYSLGQHDIQWKEFIESYQYECNQSVKRIRCCWGNKPAIHRIQVQSVTTQKTYGLVRLRYKLKLVNVIGYLSVPHRWF